MSDSVRTQRPFDEHMRTLLQTIDNTVYAGEIACTRTQSAVCHRKDTECAFRSRLFPEPCSLYKCKLYLFRVVLGEHFKQDDIRIPKDDTPFKRKDVR